MRQQAEREAAQQREYERQQQELEKQRLIKIEKQRGEFKTFLTPQCSIDSIESCYALKVEF